MAFNTGLYWLLVLTAVLRVLTYVYGKSLSSPRIPDYENLKVYQIFAFSAAVPRIATVTTKPNSEHAKTH